MNEQWREIPGFPGYKASSEGRVMGKRGKVTSGTIKSVLMRQNWRHVS